MAEHRFAFFLAIFAYLAFALLAAPSGDFYESASPSMILNNAEAFKDRVVLLVDFPVAADSLSFFEVSEWNAPSVRLRVKKSQLMQVEVGKQIIASGTVRVGDGGIFLEAGDVHVFKDYWARFFVSLGGIALFAFFFLKEKHGGVEIA